ncbi:hypothetical protein McanCB56680_004116 [Microsporum canis]
MPLQKLRLVQTRDGNSAKGNVDIILVAGINMPSVREWSILSQQWTSFFESTDSCVNIFTFDYDITLDNNFTFQTLLDEGHRLLAALSQHQQRALCVANAQKHSYSAILNSVLAIMFLGALHLPSAPEKLSEQYNLILRSISNDISKQGFARIAKESWLLANISKLFGDIEMQVEILSLYETEETRIRVGMMDGKGLFSSHRSFMLSGPEVSNIGAIREQQFRLAGTHIELPRLQQPDGQPHHQIQEWLRFVLSNSYRQAAERILSPDAPSPTISLTSLSSYDAARIALKGSNCQPTTANSATNEATAGSSITKEWQLVPILDGFNTPRRLAKLPCFMIDIPVRNNTFFGRESIIQDLDKLLLPPERPTTSSLANSDRRHVALCGIGGIGKTSIAIEYVFSRKEKFDAIFWIRSDEASKLDHDFCRIAMELGLQDTSEAFNPVVCRELAKGWLENPVRVLDHEHDIVSQADAQWLIVFDNADSPDLLQDYWPLSSNGSILVTSRDPLAKSSPSISSKYIDLAPLGNNEGAELLQRLSHVTENVEVSVKIAAKLGGLPLAISQMAAIIRYQYLSFPEFYERYEDESDRRELHSLNIVTPRPEARGNIASIWAVEQLGPHAACLLEVSAMLDPDCIQERLFTGDLGAVGQLEDFPKTSFAYSAARADLIKRSLITRNADKREFRIHRVLQDSVLSKLTPGKMLQTFSFAVDLVLAAWGSTPLVQRHAISLARSRDGLFSHTLAMRSLFEKHYQAKVHGPGLQVAKLMNEAGWYQHEKGNSEDIKPFLKLALEICNQTPGPESAQLLTDIHYGLAAAANETNDRAACLHHTEQLLKLRLKASLSTGVKDIRLAIAHNEYGIALVMNHEYEKAIAEFNTSIEVYRGLEDYWPSMDTNPRTNLGFTYWVMGDLDQSWQTLRDLLDDRETKFGVNDRESYSTISTTELVEFIMGSETYAMTVVYLMRATIGTRELLLIIKPRLAATITRLQISVIVLLSIAYDAKKKSILGGFPDRIQRVEVVSNNQTRILIDQALKVYSLRESIYLPELARTTFLKAQFAMNSGDVLEAIELFKNAKDMRSQIPDAPCKPDASLREDDFDQLVTFFSR